MTEQRPPEYPTLQHYQPSPSYCRRKPYRYGLPVTMSPMTAGNNRGTCKTRKARLSTTGTSNGSLMLWGRNSTSKKLHTTDGVIPHSVGKCPEGTKGTGSKAVQMVQNLEGLGFTVIPFGQGFRDTSPTLDINASTCSLFGGSAISSVIFKMITAFSG